MISVRPILSRQLSSPFRSYLRCYSDRPTRFQVGDRVTLTNLKTRLTRLSRPLAPKEVLDCKQGTIHLSNLINTPIPSIITSSTGHRFRAALPTLDEYIAEISRIVCPIYTFDAATLAAVIDIQPGDRVLEAGTGHGSFTSQLLRIGADILTVERRADVSKRAREVLAGYRQGQLLKDAKIQFVVGDPGVEMDARPPGEFDVVFLDMPDPQQYFAQAARALHGDGRVAIWCPSVSQIGAAMLFAKEHKKEMGLFLEETYEFPGATGAGSGLRKWDIRRVIVRASANGTLSMAEAEGRVERDQGYPDTVKREMVCRPMAGERITVGGFLGIFRKLTMEEMGKVEETHKEIEEKIEKIHAAVPAAVLEEVKPEQGSETISSPEPVVEEPIVEEDPVVAEELAAEDPVVAEEPVVEEPDVGESVVEEVIEEPVEDLKQTLAPRSAELDNLAYL